MTSVTVLGLGPMGQAFSRAVLDANHRTTVWNRTAAKAEELRSRVIVGLSSDTPDRAKITAAPPPTTCRYSTCSGPRSVDSCTP
jgi:prephenate dehydrogenase